MAPSRVCCCSSSILTSTPWAAGAPTTTSWRPPRSLPASRPRVYRTDRGGEATYHGPGQLVGYPIVDLRSWGLGPLQYVRTLERTIAATLAGFGIDAASDGYPTGVWTGGAKIAAIGVRVSRGVTTHGFALNVAPDLGYFDHIVPCGIEGCQVTSMAAEGAETDIDTVAVRLADQFQQSFGISLTPARLEQLDALHSGDPLGGLP